MKLIVILSAFTVLLSGCAAMSVEQCKTANWFNVGEKDGAAGNKSHIDKYYSSCKKANIIPSQNLYEMGYLKGLETYCQPENIFYEALEGRGNFRVCPAEKRESLRHYYQVASNFYHANSEFNTSQSNMDNYLGKLDSKDLSAKDRDDYKKKLSDLRSNSSQVRSRYQDALRNLERFKAEHHLY